MNGTRVRDYVEHTPSQFHYSERMLEPSMGRTRIYKKSGCQLVDVTQPLKRPRVYDFLLVIVKAHETVNCIPQLMGVLRQLPHSLWGNPGFLSRISVRRLESVFLQPRSVHFSRGQAAFQAIQQDICCNRRTRYSTRLQPLGWCSQWKRLP